MAGRRSVFEKHLKAGHNYGWEARWDKAVEQYRLALAEFPDEVPALVALAQAHREMGQLKQALDAYRNAVRVSPRDAMLLTQLALLEVEQGQADAAVETYMALADVHRNAGDLRQAVATWERVVRLSPDHVGARQRLAAAYMQQKSTDKAVEQQLALAGILQRMGQVEKAIQQCREALRLAPNSLAARNVMEMLREGSEAETQIVEVREEAPVSEETLTPADVTQQKALTELAGALFEERPRPEQQALDSGGVLVPDRLSADALIGQAIDSQTRGLVDEAIANYLRLLKMGEARPAIRFNLGLLFQQQLRFEEAVENLWHSVRDPEYRLGSHFALGQCYRAQGQMSKSLEHFLEVLKIVDLETVGREQADDLIQLYENLAESYRAKGDVEKAKSFSDSLVQFLSSKGWQDKVREARSRLDAAGDGVTISLAELLQAYDSDQVLRALSLSQEYFKRGLLGASSDECYRAIEYAPWYLPAHLRLADVWFELGDVGRAADKYRLVADVYLLRGEPRRAVMVYRQLLKANPADTEARDVCIRLLTDHGDYEGALEEYIAQIGMLARIAQVDQGLRLSEEALSLVEERGMGDRWQAAVLHQVGEIQVGRVEWKAALETYRKVTTLSPTDERARVRMVDLYYKLGKEGDALAQLDELVSLYRQKGEHQRVINILREMTELRPQTVELHRLLATAYQSADRISEAVQEWDMVSRLLWNAGAGDEARAVVRDIIGLNPGNVDSYRARLKQMGG